MAALFAWLKGKKTYIGVTVGALYSAAVILKVLPNDAWVWTLIATWTGVAFRSAIG